MPGEKKERKKRLSEAEVRKQGHNAGYMEAINRMMIYVRSLHDEQKYLRESERLES